MENMIFEKIKKSISYNKATVIKLAVPLFIAVMGVYLISNSKGIVHKNIEEIFQISDEIRGYYVNKPDYWKLSTAEVIRNGMISSKFIINEKIMLSGKKEIFVGSGINADPVMPLTQSYDIVIKNLGKSECISFVEYALDENRLASLLQIGIYNDTGDTLYEWGGANTLPVEKNSSIKYCTPSGNTVVWSMK